MELFKDRKEFKEWADTFRKSGVKSIKIGEMLIEFAPEALLPESDYQKKKKEREMDTSRPDPLLEQFKLDNWSSFTGEQ